MGSVEVRLASCVARKKIVLFFFLPSHFRFPLTDLKYNKVKEVIEKTKYYATQKEEKAGWTGKEGEVGDAAVLIGGLIRTSL